MSYALIFLTCSFYIIQLFTYFLFVSKCLFNYFIIPMYYFFQQYLFYVFKHIIIIISIINSILFFISKKNHKNSWETTHTCHLNNIGVILASVYSFHTPKSVHELSLHTFSVKVWISVKGTVLAMQYCWHVRNIVYSFRTRRRAVKESHTLSARSVKKTINANKSNDNLMGGGQVI